VLTLVFNTLLDIHTSIKLWSMVFSMLLLLKASYFNIKKKGIHKTVKILSNQILEADSNPPGEGYSVFYGRRLKQSM